MVNSLSMLIYKGRGVLRVVVLSVKGGDSSRIISRKQVSPCPVLESLLTQKSMEIVKRFTHIVKRSIQSIEAKKEEFALCQLI